MNSYNLANPVLQVLLLERRVAELEKESEASGEQHARLRQENLQLVHRANALDEQLKEQELRAEEHLQLETRRHKDAISKLERERGLELEYLQARSVGNEGRYWCRLCVCSCLLISFHVCVNLVD